VPGLIELRLRAASRLVALALLCASAGCGDVDGSSGNFPGAFAYESPAMDFHFYLLEPPWIPIALPTGETFFLVPPDSTITITAAAEADADYTLHIAAQSGAATTAFQNAAAAQSPPWNLSQQRTFTTTGGDAGVEISWQEAPQIYHRNSYINGSAAGTSYLMAFTAKTSLAGDQMIEQMVFSFQPRSINASRVGH
jgi:hypothetical protein